MKKRKLEDAINFVNNVITTLEDDLSHEENVEHDRARAFLIKCDLKNYSNVLDCLYELMKLVER